MSRNQLGITIQRTCSWSFYPVLVSTNEYLHFFPFVVLFSVYLFVGGFVAFLFAFWVSFV